MRITITSGLTGGATPVSVNGSPARYIEHGHEVEVSAEELHVLQNANLEGATLTIADEPEPLAPSRPSPRKRRTPAGKRKTK